MNAIVSVVIPARGSQDSIRRTIQSLAHQTCLPDEVIVVVGKDDPTRTVIEDYIDNGFVQILETDPPARFVRDAHWKRWTGARIAKGNVICFTDSNVILEEHAIQNALDLFKRYNIGAVAGIVPTWPEQSSSFMAKVQDKGLVINYPEFPEIGFLDKSNFGKSENLPVTGILLLTKAAFESIQDDFGVEFSSMASTYDDYVVGWLLVKAGITIAVTKTVIGYHKPRLSLRKYIKEISRSGQSAAVMCWQYPECPFGKRRLLQTLAVWVITVFGLVVTAISSALFGPITLLVVTVLAIGGYFVLGIANAVKIHDFWGFLIPPITTLLIFTFVVHFTKGWTLVKQKRLEPQNVQRYLQIR